MELSDLCALDYVREYLSLPNVKVSCPDVSACSCLLNERLAMKSCLGRPARKAGRRPDPAISDGFKEGAPTARNGAARAFYGLGPPAPGLSTGFPTGFLSPGP